jgi:hypothetical protein
VKQLCYIHLVEDDADLSDYDLSESESHTYKREEIPRIDDSYLNYYARLIYNLKKLIVFYHPPSESNNQNDDTAEDCFNDLTINGSDGDKPLYCVKIIVLHSLLSEFRPDYWSMVNGEDKIQIKKTYAKIKKLLNATKSAINCLFQVTMRVLK